MLSIKIETLQIYLHAFKASKVTKRKSGMSTLENGGGSGKIERTSGVLEVKNKENVIKM